MSKNGTLSDPVFKRIKFEVFEKDSYRCQYCGNVAPNITLKLHRIQEVQNNDNWLDPAYLSTSCVSCEDKRQGKSAGRNASAFIMLDELEERLEQLKMLISWRKGMVKIRRSQLIGIIDFWQDLVPGIYLNDDQKRVLLSLMNKYSSDEIRSSMRAVAKEKLQRQTDETLTKDAHDVAFEKIPETCIRNSKAKKNHEIEELYQIHDVLKERLQGFFDSDRAIQWLNYARSWEVNTEELAHMALKVTNWTQFSCNIDEMVHRQKYVLGRGRQTTI